MDIQNIYWYKKYQLWVRPSIQNEGELQLSKTVVQEDMEEHETLPSPVMGVVGH